MATQYERILAVLKDGKPHTSAELYRTGCVLHSRISVLRKRGYVIELTRADGVGANSYLYRLVATPDDASPQSTRGQAVSALDASGASLASSGVDLQLGLWGSAATPRARHEAAA